MPTRLPDHTNATRRAVLQLVLPAIFTALDEMTRIFWTCRRLPRAA